MARDRRTFTLSATTQKLLEGVGNYSAYIDTLIAQHGRDWTEALAILTTNGWRSAEILAACDACVGYGLANASREGSFLADELERAQETAAVFSQRGVTAPRRKVCTRQLREQPAIAHALATLIREYGTENQACHDAIRAVRDL